MLITRQWLRTTPRMLGLTLCAMLLFAAPVLAQEEAGDKPEPDDSSRETDISEDNYRRFMELKDPRLERPAFPTTVYKPPSSLQKMGQLPEESQKHLRNQLRGIILQSGPWTEAELQREYRFTPSAAAQRDGDLLRAEAEAWAELVGEYHEREAASLAGSIGQPGAPGSAQDPGMPQSSSMAPAPGNPGDADSTASKPSQSPSMAGGPGSDTPNQPDGGQGQSSGGQQGQGDNGESGDSSGSRSSSSSASQRAANSSDWQDPAQGPGDEMSTEGVAQSASELLRERGLARDGVNDMALEPVTDASAGQQATGRWGEEYRAVLPPADPGNTSVTPAESSTSESRASESLTTANDKPGRRDGTSAGASSATPGTLTLEQLREVQGVRLQIPVGSSETPNWGFGSDGDGAEDGDDGPWPADPAGNNEPPLDQPEIPDEDPNEPPSA